ncbi:MAG: hypothetical protein U0610_04465 [bacterium]
MIWADDVARLVNDNPLLVSLNGGPLIDEATHFATGSSSPTGGRGHRIARPKGLLVAVDGVWTNWATAWTSSASSSWATGCSA